MRICACRDRSFAGYGESLPSRGSNKKVQRKRASVTEAPAEKTAAKRQMGRLALNRCYLRLALCCGNHCRLLESELQKRFAWYFHLLAASEYLHRPSGSRADARANRSAFPHAGDCAKDSAQGRAAADLFRGILSATFALQSVIAAYHGIVMTIDHHAGQLQLQLGAARHVARFFRFGQATIDVSPLAGHQRAVHRQIGFQAGMKDVADVVFGRIHAINHTNQNALSRGNGDIAARSSGLRLSNRRGSIGWSWSRWRRWSLHCTAIACERQRHDVVDIESFNIAVLFETQHCGRAAKVAPLPNAPVLQFQSVRNGGADKQETQGGCGNETS